MNRLDAVLALIIIIPAFFGFISGFLRKIFGLLGIAAGFILAVKFFNPIGNYLLERLHTPVVSTLVVVFAVIFFLVYGVSIFLAKYFAKLHPAGNFADRILGTITGALQGVLLSSILIFNMNYLNYPSQEVKSNSFLYWKLINIAPAFFDAVISVLPDSKNINEEYKTLNE